MESSPWKVVLELDESKNRCSVAVSPMIDLTVNISTPVLFRSQRKLLPPARASGNTSDFIMNSQKLGGCDFVLVLQSDGQHAPGGGLRIHWNTSPAIQAPSSLMNSPISLRDDRPRNIKFYDATAMNMVAWNITSNFDTLKASSLRLSRTDVILVRIPAISRNTSVADPSSSTTLAPAATRTQTKGNFTAGQATFRLVMLRARLQARGPPGQARSGPSQAKPDVGPERAQGSGLRFSSPGRPVKPGPGWVNRARRSGF
ncbi:hypothetical protein FB451DRAFT_1186578 [Mycena latifolia]|nr:hypothetical protein FB451DRAFT_1186578 [Mycena latifolia]